MALLSGLFNYNKEGPGIDKNAPKKRSFIVFFEIYGRKFWKLFQANALFLLVNLPLVTRGLADVGLCKITRNFAREKHAFVKEDFFETIKKNWRQALPIGIINLLLTALFTFNVFYYATGLFPGIWTLLGADASGLQPMQPQTLDYIVMAMTSLSYVLFTWMKYYIPVMVVTFRLSLKDIYKNAFFFSTVGLWRNLLISAILIGVYALVGLLFFAFGSWEVGILVLLIAALFVPAFRSLLIQFTIFPLVKKLMIDPYYEKNPEADKQQRRDLNLDVEDTATADEPVFDDTRVTDKSATIPRQYSDEELRRIQRVTTDDEDDDTI